MAADRGTKYGDKLPEITVYDGSDDGYLDADEAYQRWARRHYKGGLDQWIYGGKCPIVPSMGIGEIHRICRLIGESAVRPKSVLPALALKMKNERPEG